jgi:hypothetical protein
MGVRSLLALSLLAAAAVGACSQSLTDKSGTGGTAGAATGTGGTGGSAVATGGVGGQNDCDALSAQYQTAVVDAQACAIGAPNQCQQLLKPSVVGCGCQVPANTSAPNIIQQAWVMAGCPLSTSAPACSSGPCRSGGNAVCAPSPDDSTGTTGICTYVSGTGGSSPDGGSDNCAALGQKYGAVLAASKSCDVGAPGQCAQPVVTSISLCSGACLDYVNDATELNQIQQAFNQTGCTSVAVLCPAIACSTPTGSACVATDAGSGTCVATYSGEPFLQ